MTPIRHFARSYAEARAKFIAAAGARDLAVASEVLPELRGVDDEALAMDVALLGPPNADAVLVLTSATHGIEGYCGSGAQVGLLHDEEFLRAARAARVAVLLVHAVNPHGFSYGRRVNEDNVDLNRNFCDFALPTPVNAAYADVHPMLLPAMWPPPKDNEEAIGAYIARHGERAFQAALTGGQYTFPDGLFFSGAGATWSNRTLRSVLRRHASGRRRVAWIDFHTALGPRGHGEKIYAGRNDPAELARARAWWGDEVTSFYDGSSTSASVVGFVTGAGYDECRGAELTAMALEYGTIPLPQVLLALRADHWLHNHPEAPEALRPPIRQQMRDAFYVEADDWKEQVFAQARGAALLTVERMSQAPA
ncbi:MAG: M14 family metallopeptidase [Casimicrobiaceae bacterium]